MSRKNSEYRRMKRRASALSRFSVYPSDVWLSANVGLTMDDYHAYQMRKNAELARLSQFR